MQSDPVVIAFDVAEDLRPGLFAVIYNYGLEYLKEKGEENQPLTSKECKFCHIETVRPKWETRIKDKGYYIIEMENCN